MQTIYDNTTNTIRLICAAVIGIPLLILWILILCFFALTLKVLNVFATETVNLTMILEETLEIFYTTDEEDESVDYNEED